MKGKIKKIKKIMSGAGALAACSLIGKAMGALYRIPLTSVIGGEGMGAYQLAMSVYVLFFTLACGGLPVAVSRIVAADRKTPRLARIAAGLGAATGAVFALAFVLLSPLFSLVQGGVKTVTVYLALAPALVFSALLSGLRGYFQGKGNLLPTSVGQLTEQAVKLTAGLWLARTFSRSGAVWGAVGALLGVSLGEIVACGAVALFFIVKPRKVAKSEVGIARSAQELILTSGLEAAADSAFGEYAAPAAKISDSATKNHAEKGNRSRNRALNAAPAAKKSGTKKLPDAGANPNRDERRAESRKNRKREVKTIVKTIIAAAAPVTLGALVMPITGVADSFTVVNVLTPSLGAAEATARYGLVGGAVSTLINLPVTVSYAFAVALLPRVAGAKNADEARREIGFSVRLALVFSTFCAAAYVIFARDVTEILYPSLSAAHKNVTVTLLRAEAPAVLYSSLLGVATAALQGAGKAGKAARNLLIGGVTKIVVGIISLYLFGIAGASVGTVACYAVALILDLAELRAIGLGAAGGAGVLTAAGCGVAVAQGVYLVFGGAAAVMRVAVGIAAGAAVTYALCGKAFGREERARLPFFKH